MKGKKGGQGVCTKGEGNRIGTGLLQASYAQVRRWICCSQLGCGVFMPAYDMRCSVREGRCKAVECCGFVLAHCRPIREPGGIGRSGDWFFFSEQRSFQNGVRQKNTTQKPPNQLSGKWLPSPSATTLADFGPAVLGQLLSRVSHDKTPQ